MNTIFLFAGLLGLTVAHEGLPVEGDHSPDYYHGKFGGGHDYYRWKHYYDKDEDEDERPKDCAPGCKKYQLGNAWCDKQCNVKECKFDNGDCQGITNKYYCAEGCSWSMLHNGIPDQACNNTACFYDGGDFDVCSPGCPK